MPWVKQSAAPSSSGGWVKRPGDGQLPPIPELTRAERLTTGLRDPLVGAGQIAAHTLPKSIRKHLMQDDRGLLQFNHMGDGGIEPDAFDEKLQGIEMDYQTRRGGDGIDGWRLGGNILSTAPLAMVTPGAAPTLLGTAVRSAATGAGTNMLNPVFDPDKSFAEQKGEQAAIGAVTAGATGAGVQAIAKAIAPKLSPAVDDLMKRGVNLTPGQIAGKGWAKAEEVLTSVPILGDFIKNAQRRSVESFNKAAYDEVLAPIGAKYTGDVVGHGGVKIVGDKLSAAYDDIVPDLQLIPDEQFSADLTAATAGKELMSEGAAKQFEKIVETTLPRGPLSGAPLKALESKLNQLISKFGGSQDPSDQMISEALGEMRSAMLSNLARVNPAHAEKLGAINSGWASLVRLERAAANTKEGVFTPEGLLGAVKTLDDSVRKRGTARGTAGPMQDLGKAGNEALGRTYPDSGTGGRMLTGGAVMGYIDPTLLATAAAGSAPYTEFGQKIATAILAKRPVVSQQLRAMLERGTGPVGTLSPLSLGLVSPPPKKRR